MSVVANLQRWPDEPHFLIITVLVFSSYCNKMPLTGWLINHRHSFLTVLEAGKTKTKRLPDLGSGTRSIDGCLWLGPHKWRGSTELSRVSDMGTNPFVRPPLS